MTARAPLVVVGDALLDEDVRGDVERLAPDAPVPVVSGAHSARRPGGAALAAWLAARDGREVTLVTALGADASSRAVRELLAGSVRLVELPLRGALPHKTRVLGADRPLLRLDEGEGRAREATEEARATVRAARGLLVADYGRGAAEVLRAELERAAVRVPLVWDPHPRGEAPVTGTRLVTPSAAEAAGFARRLAPGPAHRAASPGSGALERAARDGAALLRAWGVTSVAVTLGERGALLTHGETPLFVPAAVSAHGDACGAGDRFAATAAGLLADEALPEEAVRAAVAAATRYVAEGGAAVVAHGRPGAASAPPGAHELAERVRTRGGTVTAAGGCFDLLHAGHVALLEAARRTGDCLIVCLNSDASVRRRKGPGRPLVEAADRMRVLNALECVDAVAVFDEDTPERLLGELRPHIWAKGGDYARSSLPETRLVESWGGQVLLLPYLDGRSTTSLAERAARPPAPAPESSA
ncbi:MULTISPECIES: D-glycero-beta-D-manno-heptose 1-phosphate adenylyltransferase [Streptomyces]|uniref:D-glycero-beta-D-manno-heptose 1-phosphate adenylyltransferase n=1 Tax=Streptomyces TaxID=1883 RepID=UPI00101E4C55|nr:D-glycero-beta-D-manno-heptose 1-phosphate adenylyltransferase [Streptomyces albidoflavus]RZE96704.1 D-glycero-beta-D-manno-heptose 1-phosphate adenylyltransferase [Streptomyces albidoflavus]RZE98156.1 D-glycero-beta-D-manno-heptose 1-phosphate adenylyltransferase [Streptomyces albidoflavus]